MQVATANLSVPVEAHGAEMGRSKKWEEGTQAPVPHSSEGQELRPTHRTMQELALEPQHELKPVGAISLVSGSSVL